MERWWKTAAGALWCRSRLLWLVASDGWGCCVQQHDVSCGYELSTTSQRECLSARAKSCSHRQLSLHSSLCRPLLSAFYLPLSISSPFARLLTSPATICKQNSLVSHFTRDKVIFAFCLKTVNRLCCLVFLCVALLLWTSLALLVRSDLSLLAQMVGGWTGQHKSQDTEGSSFLLPLGSAARLLPGLPSVQT